MEGFFRCTGGLWWINLKHHNYSVHLGPIKPSGLRVFVLCPVDVSQQARVRVASVMF